MGVSQYRLAKEIGVPQHRIYEIAKGKRAITVDTALRLARFFGMSDRFWLNLQVDYDLRKARHLKQELEKEINPWSSSHVTEVT